MQRNYSPDWQTAYADVDIAYGALYIRDYGDYADVVEVTDLDSAAGTTNMVLVQVGTVGLYGRDLATNRQRFDEAIRSGIGRDGLASAGAHKRLVGWAALWEYGYRDVDEENIIATDTHNYDGGRDGWKPTERSFGPDRVNGTDGLKRWLARYCEVTA